MTFTLGHSDRLSRYLFNQGKEFTVNPPRVKPRAFERDAGEEGLSTYLTESLTEAAVWALGITLRPHQTLKARADLRANDFLSVGLKLDPDNKPERHVYVLGWPTDDVDELQKRADLAKLARVPVIRPVPA